MAIIVEEGDKSKWIKAKGVMEKIKRTLYSNSIHIECGGRWINDGDTIYGMYSKCERCGCKVYET